MALQGKDPIHSKACPYNKVTEQVNRFKYFGYYITYGHGKVIIEKILNYNRAMRIIKPNWFRYI
jgi:hypothetical protein